MSVRYQTNYSNEVHQLIVSVSRHMWVGKDGAIRYQRKAFEISLAALPESTRRHIVHYLVRDHYSGAFYGEIAMSPCLPDACEFLNRAWSRKDQLSFCGVPDSLTVPGTVFSRFPDVLPRLNDLGVEIIKATSGFQAGVRDLRTWEEEFRYKLSWYPATDLNRLPALAELMMSTISQISPRLIT